MKYLRLLVPVLLCCALLVPARAAGPEVNAKAALLMELSTGQVLYQAHAHDQLEPASVTKVMTMLLIMEAIDSGQLTYDTMIPVSANAAGMGGSQVYLKEGEQFSVHDMLKAIAVASGNDAAVAMAEYLAGSEGAFTDKMNARARELGMEDTAFQNCTGLPTPGHHTSAYDIALMSRELMEKHPDIRNFTTIWMDSLRDGTFQLTNTNKLIRFYDGATGLKTGSTDSALYCISATARREGMELIAVVLGSPTSGDRFETAKSLLGYGFAGYTLVTAAPSEPLSHIPVTLGTADSVQPVSAETPQLLLAKGDAGKLTTTVDLPETLTAPVAQGQELGRLTVLVDGVQQAAVPLIAGAEVPRLSLWQVYQRVLGTLLGTAA